MKKKIKLGNRLMKKTKSILKNLKRPHGKEARTEGKSNGINS